MNYNKYICQKKEKQQYTAVGTERMFIETNDEHLVASLTDSPYTTKIASTIFKCKHVRHTISVFMIPDVCSLA